MTSEAQKVRLFQNQSPPNRTVFVLGATGCGKTTLIANMLLGCDRWIIFDTKEEYDPSFFGDNPTPVVVSSLKGFVEAINTQPKIIVRVPAGDEDSDVRFINLICWHLIEFQRLNPRLTTCFCMDELNRFVSVNFAPSGLKEIIQRGRGYRIEKVLGAQWFNSVPTWVRDSFSEIYVFRHSEPRGIAMLECYGFVPSEIRMLPPHTVLRLSHGEVKTLTLTATGD